MTLYTNNIAIIDIDWSAIEPIEKPPAHLRHDKWIIITSINHPTEDVKKLAGLTDWKVVVVGDTKSPGNWSYPNCIFLDIKEQLKLGYKSTQLIEFKSYARKSIGYLYAIQHGAKVIYDTDDDNSPTTGNIGFDPDSKLEYLVYQASNQQTVNPYVHFGQSTVWPRGYPLDRISDEPLYSFKQCRQQRALVQQGVVNGDPDVDAIYRLTRKDSSVDLKIEFDSDAPPVLLPTSVMAPYNSQNTLHLYDAFWGLVLPQTVTFRVCDIWRGYWAQRLLWEINGHLAFFPPNAYTYRNAHNYLLDFIDENDLYQKSSYLVDFLIKWKSTKISFFDRILELTLAMYEHDFWGKKDVLLIKYWLEDLIKVGYQPAVSMGVYNGECLPTVKTVVPKEKPSSYLRTSGKLAEKFLDENEGILKLKS